MKSTPASSSSYLCCPSQDVNRILPGEPASNCTQDTGLSKKGCSGLQGTTLPAQPAKTIEVTSTSQPPVRVVTSVQAVTEASPEVAGALFQLEHSVSHCNNSRSCVYCRYSNEITRLHALLYSQEPAVIRNVVLNHEECESDLESFWNSLYRYFFYLELVTLGTFRVHYEKHWIFQTVW
jgi:hypothetical protein